MYITHSAGIVSFFIEGTCYC